MASGNAVVTIELDDKISRKLEEVIEGFASHVAVVDLPASAVLVVSHPDSVSLHALEQITRLVSDAFGGRRTLVLSEGMTLDAVIPEPVEVG